MIFVTPPENQGQIVTVSYACDEISVFMERLDRSDRSATYFAADWENLPEDEMEKWDPVNQEPSIPADAWVPIPGRPR